MKHKKDENFNFDEDLGMPMDEHDDIHADDDMPSEPSELDEFDLEAPAPSDAELEDEDFQLDPDEDEILNSKEPQPNGKKAKSSLIDLLKANVIYIVGGLAVLAIGYYMIFDYLGFGSSSAQSHRVEHRSSHDFGMKTGVQASNPIVLHKNQIAMRPVTNVVMNEADMKKLLAGFNNAVQENIANVSTQITGLKAEVATISKARNSTQKYTEAMAQSITLVAGQMQVMSKNMSAYQREMAATQKALVGVHNDLNLLLAERTAQMQKLTLRAVVPGRAWLVDGAGHTDTVTVGTTVPSYGKVTKIDPSTGEVFMSSGYIFK